MYNKKIDREGNKERRDLACYNGAAAAAEKKMKDGVTWLLGEIRLSVKFHEFHLAGLVLDYITSACPDWMGVFS